VAKREGEREWRLWLGLTVLALGVAYVIAFVVKNSKSVKIHWVVGSSHSSVIWLIVVNLLIGVGAGVLISWLYRRRRGRSHPRAIQHRGEPADSVGDLSRRDEAERKPS
jgi:uncharacterized BrkB/YihY/UPF0761 family membrane protein